MKVQKAAEKAQIETGAFCTMNAQKFKDLADKANISYDRFIRTTEDDHKAAVEYFFVQLQQRGYIYESKHEGWYCVSDETFYPESQIHLVIEPQTGRKIFASKETGKEVQWASEQNYHFKLSSFQEKLLQLYKDNPDLIVPEARMNFIVSEVSSGLSDLSISRPASRLQWGIRVPGDESQTIYVWLDALINYITMAGYPFVSKHPLEKIWPPNCQVIGKDIIRFHCIYWPAFLMALDLPVAKQFLSHAHWMMNEEKMSKSLGNVVNPFMAMDRFGVDPIRFYMIRDGGYADDSSYDNSFIIERYKNDLQGGLGNMLSRILRYKPFNVVKSIEFVRPSVENKDVTELPDQWADLQLQFNEFIIGAHQAMEQSNPRKALENILKIVNHVNKYFQEAQPWRKSDSKDSATQDHLKEIVYHSLECLRIASIMLQPFMPDKMKTALDMLGVREDMRTLEQAKLFCDFEYGVPMTDIGIGGKSAGTLFPPLLSDF
jgi:methionyl-tRNA synthetase